MPAVSKEARVVEKVSCPAKDRQKNCPKCKKGKRKPTKESHMVHDGNPYCTELCFVDELGVGGWARGGIKKVKL